VEKGPLPDGTGWELDEEVIAVDDFSESVQHETGKDSLNGFFIEGIVLGYVGYEEYVPGCVLDGLDEIAPPPAEQLLMADPEIVASAPGLAEEARGDVLPKVMEKKSVVELVTE
jgi:hypothetical protein